MSERKNISKQDLKNIDLVLENDVQCSGLNIGGRAYEFVSGGYDVLELTGTSGTLTEEQLLDLFANDSIVIKRNLCYYIKTQEDVNYIYYNCVNYVNSTNRKISDIVITKATRGWAINDFTLRNQGLTITDINANITPIENRASIINGVLYIHFRGTLTDNLPNDALLFKIPSGIIVNNCNFTGLASFDLALFQLKTSGEMYIKNSVVSGKILDFSASILL